MNPAGSAKQLSKCDYVVEQIKAQIMDGTYKDGAQLPPEPALCELFGVSRITIREALKKLNMMGLVDIRQGKGTFVKQVDLSVLMRPLFQKIRFDDIEVEAIYDARAYIESGTAALAARNRTDGDLESLEEILRNLKYQISRGDLLKVDEYDHAFHLRVAKASGNPILLACLTTLEEINDVCVGRYSKYMEMMDNCYGEHYAIYEAILQQDASAASVAMVIHAQNSKAFYL